MRKFFRRNSRNTKMIHSCEVASTMRRLRFENLEDRRLLAVFTVNPTDDLDVGTGELLSDNAILLFPPVAVIITRLMET